MNCHVAKGCAVPSLARRAQSPEDSCIECHMPRARTSNVAHLATTHHGIVRFRQAAYQTEAPQDAPAGTPSLVPFHRPLMSDAELRSTGRDLGVALRGEGGRYTAEALPLLEKAHRDHPDDVLAWESMGFALWGVGQKDEGLSVFEAVLEQFPDRESTLASAAQLAGVLKRPDRAICLWRRTIAIDPWRSDYFADLAEQLAAVRDWPGAIEAAQHALQLSPANRTARLALTAATFHSGLLEAARKQLDTLLDFDPPDRRELIRWFEALR
jgi:tetratricopeptide (TPR) repeat protein